MPELTTPADHGRWEDRMIEALDGRADGPRRAELDRHLAACGKCRVAFADYRRVFEGVRAELPEGVSGAAVIEVAERLRARRGRAGVVGGLVAAGIAVVVLAALFLEAPRPAGEPQAFTTVRGPELPGPPAPGDSLPEIADAGPDAALLALADGLGEGAAEGLPVVAEARDPLAGLAELEEAFAGLTAEEVEGLLILLEAQSPEA